MSAVHSQMRLACEEVEAGAHSGEGEEERKQEHGDDGIEAGAQRGLPGGNAREAEAGEEGSEERMDPDGVGGCCGGENGGEDDGKGAVRESDAGLASGQTLAQRTDDARS